MPIIKDTSMRFRHIWKEISSATIVHHFDIMIKGWDIGYHKTKTGSIVHYCSMRSEYTFTRYGG